MKNDKPSLSEWISFTAVTIAAIALIISAWQALMLREHNKISVKPLLDIEKQHGKVGYDDVVWLSLRNDGLGPAIIVEHSISFEGSKLEEDRIWQIIGDAMSTKYGKIQLLPNKTVVRPGESQKFLRLREISLLISDADMQSKEAHIDFLNLNTEVQFKSLYNEVYSYSCKFGDIFLNISKAFDWSP